MRQVYIQQCGRRAGKSITVLAGIWYRNDPAALTVQWFYYGRHPLAAPKPPQHVNCRCVITPKDQIQGSIRLLSRGGGGGGGRD